MKKKILYGVVGLLIIASAISLLKAGNSTTEIRNDGTVTEQNRPMPEKDPSGDGMIWDVSGHFMTIE